MQYTIDHYTCEGEIRGADGRRFATAYAAEVAREHDAEGCRAVGGYSDRVIYAVARDGSKIGTVAQDHAGVWRLWIFGGSAPVIDWDGICPRRVEG